MRKAFTLIELVAAIVIIAILTVAAIIPITSTYRIKLDGAANKLMFDVRYAQQLAINRHTTCGVSFDIGGNSYFVYIGNTAVKAKDPVSRQDLIVNYTSDIQYRGISLVSTNFGDQVSFDYIGIPYNSSGVALASQGSISLQSRGYTKAVTIEVATGEVKL